ncbi:thioredoxin-like domain-containing protein [Mycobacterium riyadhense]|uniref:Alkyl hydroperoxide reductase n=1 Tax=Mycobacterium riyadhense TaxID=486698 RepID=A0A1X2CH48_9MYCO|nr:thioredoxin-like domain-containing protein [Mycobacterium riyadhense]MCV7148553.1 redoxin domain-containing protein [Mycobacterium riyadhense]ORW75278.1 alkyl hydroperoxide reductase [Mycobacterium riyadhense]
MPDQPATTTRRAAPRSRRRLVWIAVAAAAVLAIAVVLYSALSRSNNQTAPEPAAGPGETAAPVASATFTAQTLQGQQITVPDGSRPSVLLFFSVACGGCGPTAHALGQAQQATGAKATFVAVNIDPADSEQDIKDFLTANQATGLAYTRDTNATLMSTYQATQVSTVVVLDTSGRTAFRAVEPGADTIRAELGKVGA